MTKTENQRPKTEKITWLLFFLVIIAIYLFALDGFPLVGPDEPRYSQVAREMFERNDFVTPTLGGANWFEKPALLYWLQIVFFNIFGVSEFSARFGSALFGLGTIASLWILGNFVTQRGKDAKTQRNLESGIWNLEYRKTNFANWLALIAASSVGLMAFSRGASFDIILTFPITASLVSFFIFDQTRNPPAHASGSDSASPRHRVSASLFAFYFFIGVALLAKGLIGIVLPFAIVGFYYLLSRKLPSKTFIFSLFWGTLFSFLVASLWYLPMYLRHGWEFIDEFFIQHHFQRYTSNKYRHPQPFWFFWLVLPLMTIPWLPFFLASIWNQMKRIFHNQGEERKKEKIPASPHLRVSASPLLLFSLSWLLVPLVFFSFSGSKLPGYILPALPAALIFTAIYVHQFVRKSANRKFLVQFLAFATFAVVAFLLRFVVPNFAADDSTKYLISAANARGYTTEKVLNLHTISHNAEFYAAGRLIREPDGKLRKFLSAAEILEEIKKENKPVLVLVLHEYLHELTESDLVRAEVLNKNAEHAIVFVRAKN